MMLAAKAMMRRGFVLTVIASVFLGTTSARGSRNVAPLVGRAVATGPVVALAATPTAVWIGEIEKDDVRVRELDPATLRTRWQARGFPRLFALAATGKTVWAGSHARDLGVHAASYGRVVSIDARSHRRSRVLSRVEAMQATTYRADAIVLAPRILERLSRDRVVWKQRLPVGNGTAVAIAGRTIFAAAEDPQGIATDLYTVDAKTGHITNRTKLKIFVGAIAASSKTLWLLNGDTLYMMRRPSAKPRLLLRKNGLSSLIWQRNALWVGTTDGHLDKFTDAGTLEGSFPITTTVNAVIRAGGSDHLWVFDSARRKLISVRIR